MAPSNIGIKAVEIYIPNKFVDQKELEKHDGVAEGKYTIGLGQERMAFCDDREDVYSLSLTVTKSLLKKYNIDPRQIGRLEVGTETLLDKSKSVKSVLMQLFEESGNYDIEGVDNINACYGGTNALFNAVSWVESSYWDGRFALVIAVDIALYAKGNARPTGGAGAVAMLIGPDAPIVFEPGLRGSYMAHVYDFYKPNLSSEFPVVDGHYSVSCYIRALDESYQAYKRNVARKTDGIEPITMNSFDYCCFHAPIRKQTVKAYARMLYSDYLDIKTNDRFEDIREQLEKVTYEESLTSKEVEKTLVAATKAAYSKNVAPSTLVSAQVGNTYTASVYFCLVSLLVNVAPEVLKGKRVGVYSYGSGLASSFFSLRIAGDVSEIAQKVNLHKRLENRKQFSPTEYESAVELRHKCYGVDSVSPQGAANGFEPGTFYLTEVDDKYRRSYAVA